MDILGREAIILPTTEGNCFFPAAFKIVFGLTAIFKVFTFPHLSLPFYHSWKNFCHVHIFQSFSPVGLSFPNVGHVGREPGKPRAARCPQDQQVWRVKDSWLRGLPSAPVSSR